MKRVISVLNENNKVVVEFADGTKQELSEVTGEGGGMNFYKVTLDTVGGKLVPKHGDTTLTYQDLKTKYESDVDFIYIEHDGLTMIPVLPPLETDPVIEFTCTWVYGNDVKVSRVIVNENNEVKYENTLVCSGNKVLWSGDVSFSTPTVVNLKLAEKVSEQATGIVIVYGATGKSAYGTLFIPKNITKQAFNSGKSYVLESIALGIIYGVRVFDTSIGASTLTGQSTSGTINGFNYNWGAGSFKAVLGV